MIESWDPGTNVLMISLAIWVAEFASYLPHMLDIYLGTKRLAQSAYPWVSWEFTRGISNNPIIDIKSLRLQIRSHYIGLGQLEAAEPVR